VFLLPVEMVHKAVSTIFLTALCFTLLQVSRRLPRSALDPLMGPLPPGPPSPPDLTFRVTRGSGDYTGLVLYTHRTYSVRLVLSRGGGLTHIVLWLGA